MLDVAKESSTDAFHALTGLNIDAPGASTDVGECSSEDFPALGSCSYVGAPFLHDIFVSYCHGDPKGTGRTPLATWTHRLFDELVQDIQSTTLEFDAFDPWIDRDIDPTAKLTSELKEKVSKSALLLIVMSPRYLGSSWCKDELNWFEQELQRRDEREGCTLVVRALPTPEEQWPPLLKDDRGHSVIGFYFHPRPIKDGIRAFGWPEPKPSDREFYDVLSKLSTAIQQRLRRVKQREVLRTNARKSPNASQAISRVYLHSRLRDIQLWKQIREQLLSHGYEVLPELFPCDLPDLAGLRRVQEQRRRRVAAYLDSDVLLILRPEAGDWINDELQTVGFDELRELDAFYHKRIPCAVLDFAEDGLMKEHDFGVTRVSADALWVNTFSKWLNTFANYSRKSTETKAPLH